MTNEIKKFCEELDNLYEYADVDHHQDMVARVDDLIDRVRDYEYSQGISTSLIMRVALSFRKKNQQALNAALRDREPQ